MSKIRDRYFKGYVKEKELVGEKGKYKTRYVYHGNYYYWKAGKDVIRLRKKLYGVLTAVNLVIMFALTIIDSEASRNTYVMIPVLAAIVPLIYEVIGFMQFSRTGDKVREFDFEEINIKLRYASLAYSTLMAAAAVISLVWLFFADDRWSFVLTAFLGLVCSASSLVIYIKHRRLGSMLVEEGDYGDIEDEGD